MFLVNKICKISFIKNVMINKVVILTSELYDFHIITIVFYIFYILDGPRMSKITSLLLLRR
jgi:hypothetical protein